jgi:hypothetical protein
MRAGPPVIEKVTVEVQYEDAIGAGPFFDRAGLVLRHLLDELGPPFVPVYEGSPFRSPTLASASERLTLEYNEKHLIVVQDWVETIARIEQVAVIAWGEVNEQFQVQNRVKRAGVHLLFMWPATSADEAEARLLGLGLFSDPPGTEEIFGAIPRKRSYTAVVGTDERPVRYHLAGASAVVEGGAGQVPESLKKFQIPSGILLDVDCGQVLGGKGRRTIKQSDLQAFIRESSRRSIDAARALGQRL